MNIIKIENLNKSFIKSKVHLKKFLVLYLVLKNLTLQNFFMLSMI